MLDTNQAHPIISDFGIYGRNLYKTALSLRSYSHSDTPVQIKKNRIQNKLSRHPTYTSQSNQELPDVNINHDMAHNGLVTLWSTCMTQFSLTVLQFK